MKPILKTLLALLVFAVILTVLTACEPLEELKNLLSGECEHSIVNDDEVPATCTSKGLSEGYHCTKCGKTILEQLETNMLPHTQVTVKGKEATCTESGLTDGVKCSVCDTVIEEQQVIEAKGHGKELISGKEPTCTSAGVSDGERCPDCGVITVEQHELPALDHSITILEGQAPTCQKTGLTEGQRCSLCHTILVEQTVIPIGTHSYKDENDITCDVCGYTRECSHPESEVVTVNGRAPGCSEAGLTDGKECGICGEILEAQSAIPATGHTVEVIPGKDATCTESGMTSAERCSVCLVTIKENLDIPALGHSYGEWTELTAPTYTAEGEERRDCTVCDHFETRKTNLTHVIHFIGGFNSWTAGDMEYLLTESTDKATWTGTLDIPAASSIKLFNSALGREGDGWIGYGDNGANLELAAGRYSFTYSVADNAFTYDVIEIYNTASHEMYFRGDHNNWGNDGLTDADKLTESEDKATWTGTIVVEAGNGFKLYNKAKDKWLGDENDGNFYLSAGTYTVVYTVENDNITFTLVPGTQPDPVDPPAEETVTYYLVPNENWKQAGARFACYAFDGSDNAWFDFTDDDGDGVYEVTVPAKYTSVIFCRMNPAATENGWGGKWNQTADLSAPEGMNCYTIAEGSWESGSWSAYALQ